MNGLVLPRFQRMAPDLFANARFEPAQDYQIEDDGIVVTDLVSIQLCMDGSYSVTEQLNETEFMMTDCGRSLNKTINAVRAAVGRAA